MSTFADHFSRQAKQYAHYRPHYPPELSAYLSSLCKEHQLAWDCATGNGQAATELAKIFAQVVATDASDAQIANAEKRSNIEYRVESAEQTSLLTHSVDLITVAQAYHWFDIPVFAEEVQRVLKPNGIIAAWCYGLFKIDTSLDQLIEYFYHDIVGPYWPAGRQYIDEHYTTVAFPFKRIPTPQFYMQAEWSAEQVLGYLNTWSAVNYYKKAQHRDPVAEFATALLDLWGNPQTTKKISWEIFLLAGNI